LMCENSNGAHGRTRVVDGTGLHCSTQEELDANPVFRFPFTKFLSLAKNFDDESEFTK
jgi:hypothetical protein